PARHSRWRAVAAGGWRLGLLNAWPVALLALLWVLRWPQFLSAAGLAVLAATTGRALTVWLAHSLAAWTARAPVEESTVRMLANPLEWAMIIAGVVLGVRAWRLAGDTRQILPPDVQAASTARQAWAHGLLAVTGVYALVLLGYAGASRYQASAHLLQPGVDPWREQEALLALNEGAAQVNKGDLDAADRSFQR